MPFTNSERYIAGTKAMLCTVCVGYKTIKLRESFCSAGNYFMSSSLWNSGVGKFTMFLSKLLSYGIS